MKRLLIIDDEEKILRYYKEYLESEGFEVLTSRNAREGTFTMLKSGKVDLILLDINMPEVDGGYMQEVIEEFDPEQKILAFSVHSVEEQRSILSRAVDYFDKSDPIEMLLEKITMILKEEEIPAK